MKAKASFSILLPYLMTEYEQLKPLAIATVKEGTRYRWYFNWEDFESVAKLVGKDIEFEKGEIESMLEMSPAMKRAIKTDRYKGTGKFEIKWRSPKIYIIETIINKKVVQKKIPVEAIQTAWDVMRNYPINKPIKTRTVAERICDLLGIDRFNREESGTFDFAKFFGERADYYRYFYAPIKVLEAEGVVLHHKDGRVERTVDSWELQTEFDEDVQ